MVSGGMACIKYLLFIFNLIFAITGIVLISFGAIFLVTYNDYSNFLDNWLFAAPVLMIIVGVIVFLVSFFGCCGAVKENHCMIITFSVLLMLIFALELGAGISGYVMRSEVGTTLENRMNKTMIEYNEKDDVRKSWDIMQHDLGCCGINGPSDWSKAGFNDNILPITCCKNVPLNIGNSSRSTCHMNTITVREQGCVNKLRTSIEDKGVVLGGVGLGIALVQLIGVIFACCLARSIRQEYETVETTPH